MEVDKSILSQTELSLHLTPNNGIGDPFQAFTVQDFYRCEDLDGTQRTIRPLIVNVVTNLLGEYMS